MSLDGPTRTDLVYNLAAGLRNFGPGVSSTKIVDLKGSRLHKTHSVKPVEDMKINLKSEDECSVDFILIFRMETRD